MDVNNGVIIVNKGFNYEAGYYLLKYFSKNLNDLEKTIISDIGLDLKQNKIYINHENLRLEVETTKKNFSKIAEKFKEYL